VPEPDSKLESSRILHYPVTSGLPGFTTSGSAEIQQIPDIRIRPFRWFFAVSFGRNVIHAHQYSADDIDLEHVQHIKDLGITFDVKLNFSLHISEKVNKANSILGIIKRNFRSLSQESFVMLYKTLVHSHLEYANAILNPYKKCDIYVLDGVKN